jgi:hypothetical protein
MQVEQVHANVSAGQDFILGAQIEPARLAVGASYAEAHPKMTGASFKNTGPFHWDISTGRLNNESNKCKFRRHRYRRPTRA